MTRNPLAAYGLALAAVIVAVAVRLLLDPVLGDGIPFVTLFLAVAVAAWYGGRGPGVLALVAGAVGVAFLVMEPRYTFPLGQLEYRIGLLVYAVVGLGSVALFEALHKARRRAEGEAAARRAAEAALAEQAERLRTTLASIGDAVITTDAEGRITMINAVAESLTGWTNAEAVGRPLDAVLVILNENTRRPVENPAAKALAEGVIVGLANHTVLIAKDGTERPVDDSAAPIRAPDGTVFGCVLVFRSIRERKLAEEKLQQEKERERRRAAELETVLATVPACVWIAHDPACGRITGNRASTDLLQLPSGTNLSLSAPDVERPTHFKVFKDGRELLPHELPVQRAAGGENVRDFEEEIVFDDGTRCQLFGNAAPLRDEDGRVRGAVAAFVDVTERRRVEERQRLLTEAAEVLLTTDDPEAMLKGVFAKIGPHFGLDTYFNFMVDESGSALRRASFVGIPDDAARNVERLEFGQAVCGQVALSRRPVVARRIQQTDEPRTALVKSFGIRAYACNPLLAGGDLLGTLSFGSRSRDEFDADELAFFRTVCHYVAAAYERLRLIHRLREADRRKDEFLATLAHELRNPLAPIRNGLQVMKLAGNDADTVERCRSMMERQLGQMVRLVDDLMDVSRISRDKIELRRQRVQLAAVVDSAVEETRLLIDQMGHELTVTQPKGSVVVNADPARLSQVFANLLNNAAKYSERGGHIWLTVEPQGIDVLVSVRDTGIGIPADKRTSIFDIFSQVDRSLEKSHGGLGIGLSLVKRLVEMHGGRVEAKSDGPGRGTEFIVRLPVDVEASGLQATDQQEKPAALKSSLRILIVDDNRDGANSLAMMLKIMGNDTRTAYDGKEGVELAREFQPDVVLFDIGMPKLNGYEACRLIRKQPFGQKAIVIAMTGWSQEGDRQRSHEAGFDHHMVKPVDPGALMKLLAGLSDAVRK